MVMICMVMIPSDLGGNKQGITNKHFPKFHAKLATNSIVKDLFSSRSAWSLFGDYSGAKASSKNDWKYASVWWDNSCSRWWRSKPSIPFLLE
jgi:hypothetical protein